MWAWSSRDLCVCFTAQLDELDSASLILLLAYTMNSLFWGMSATTTACAALSLFSNPFPALHSLLPPPLPYPPLLSPPLPSPPLPAVYLCTQGVSPKAHPVKKELVGCSDNPQPHPSQCCLFTSSQERLQKAMGRAKVLSEKRRGGEWAGPMVGGPALLRARRRSDLYALCVCMAACTRLCPVD